MVPEMWNKPLWKRVWRCLDLWDNVRLRTASTHWNVPGKYGPQGELFFFHLKKEPMVLSKLVEFGLCFSAETVKARALTVLHMMAEENALWSDRDSSPDLGETWKYGCPQSRVWSDDGLENERGEDTSSVEHYEHNVDKLAIEVVGQNWTSEVISLFLEDWEVGRVALSSHLSMDLSCQEMRDVCEGSLEFSGFSSVPSVRRAKEVLWWSCHSSKAFSSPWTGCDNKGEGCGERFEGEGT